MRNALLIFTFTALAAFGQMASYPPAAGLPSGSTLPSTCSVGAAFILTTGALYTCSANNVWALPPASGAPTAANWRGVYAAGTTYAAGDAVIYGTPAVGYVSAVEIGRASCREIV